MIRNVKLYSPFSLYWGRMKMALDEFHIMQISDIHDAAMVERGLHPDYATISYVERYAETIEDKKINQGIEQLEREIKKNVMEEMRSLLGDYIFAAFIHKLVSNPDELFVYKKQFTSYLAAQSFFSYVFKMSHKELNSFMFCKRTGKVYYSGYTMSHAGIDESPLRNDVQVPFRLTPNIQYFITPIGIEGPFAGAITAAALSIRKNKLLYLSGYLRLFYKDLLEDEPALEGQSAANKQKVVAANYERTRSNILGLTDMEPIEKLFASRHAVFKTETVKVSGGEERREDTNEKVYWTCFNQKVYSKIKEAMDPGVLNEMSLAWAPWF